MRRAVHTGLALALAILPAQGAFAAPEPDFAAAIGAARQSLQALVPLAEIPGLCAAVGYADSIVWCEGFGFADRENDTPVTCTTRFRIASVTKVLTAAVTAKLVEQGKLDLDAPVTRYVPSWPETAPPITARLLAGHLGGIRDYRRTDRTEKHIDDQRYENVTAALAIFRDDSLVAAPGTRYTYSTFGYTLLSAALEGAAGRDFLTLVDDLVLEPLDLRSTMPNLPDARLSEMTTLYARDDSGKVTPTANVAPSYKWAAGGYVSTASDIVRFGLAHLRPGFLRAETLALLFTSQRTAAGEETGVGIGWMQARDPWGCRLLFHNGSQAGARSVLALWPDDGLAVVILTNLTNTPTLIEGTAMGVARPFLQAIGGCGTGGAVADTLVGHWNYVAGGSEPAATGGLEIGGVPGNWSGGMSTSAGARVPVLPLTDLFATADGAGGVLAAPEGLLLLRLRAAPDGLAGALTFHNGLHPFDLPITLRRR